MVRPGTGVEEVGPGLLPRFRRMESDPKSHERNSLAVPNSSVNISNVSKNNKVSFVKKRPTHFKLV